MNLVLVEAVKSIKNAVVSRIYYIHKNRHARVAQLELGATAVFEIFIPIAASI
jgi:hypothetical protein